jgi:hypothetical protein
MYKMGIRLSRWKDGSGKQAIVLFMDLVDKLVPLSLIQSAAQSVSVFAYDPDDDN